MPLRPHHLRRPAACASRPSTPRRRRRPRSKREAAQIIPAMRGQILDTNGRCSPRRRARDHRGRPDGHVHLRHPEERRATDGVARRPVQPAAAELAPLLDTDASPSSSPELPAPAATSCSDGGHPADLPRSPGSASRASTATDARPARAHLPQGARRPPARRLHRPATGRPAAASSRCSTSSCAGTPGRRPRAGPRRHIIPVGQQLDDPGRRRPRRQADDRPDLQWYAQNAARQAGQGDQGAQSGTAVVMEVETGKLLGRRAATRRSTPTTDVGKKGASWATTPSPTPSSPARPARS